MKRALNDPGVKVPKIQLEYTAMGAMDIAYLMWTRGEALEGLTYNLTSKFNILFTDFITNYAEFRKKYTVDEIVLSLVNLHEYGVSIEDNRQRSILNARSGKRKTHNAGIFLRMGYEQQARINKDMYDEIAEVMEKYQIE